MIEIASLIWSYWISRCNINIEIADCKSTLESQCYPQFTHNIEIKRYCNIKIKRDFSSNIFFLCELKIFIFGQLCLLKPSLKLQAALVICGLFIFDFQLYFKMSQQYFEEINIFLSQYCVQKYCVWHGPHINKRHMFCQSSLHFCNVEF